MKVYDEMYLNDAMKNLATAFDYAINDLKIVPNQFVNRFINSREAYLFEIGAPHIITGMSGYELINRLYGIDKKSRQKN